MAPTSSGVGGVLQTERMRASRLDLLRMRLAAHSIEGPKASSPSAAVERMLAVQAQDFGAACWAVGLRTRKADRDDVLAALDAGTIVRSWPMRGTLHFVSPSDLRWMLAVTTERMIAGLASRHRQLELDTPDFVAARDIVTEALTGGRSLGRAELMALWEERGVATGGQRGYHLIYYLAQTGVLCWGPTHKTQQSLVLLDEWAPDQRSLEHDEALAEFFLRYLTGHGPATIKDFVWWTKGTVAGVKTALAVLGDAVTCVDVDGATYWMTSELAETAPVSGRPPSRAAARLLPAFDEYLLGYQDRSLVLDQDRAAAVVPGGNGVFAPFLISRGRIVGTWRRREAAARVVVEAAPFTQLSTAQVTALTRSTREYGVFLGSTASLHIDTSAT